MEGSIFLALFILGLFQCGCTEMTFYHWQCSLPSNNTIKSLVAQNQEAFRVIGWPIWMSTEYKSINCFQKGLKHIPQGLSQDVEVLDLGKNSITRIRQNDFAAYSSLVAISMINNCPVTDLYDSSVRRCVSYLVVDKGAFSNLHKLKFLALSGTVMKQLPELLPSSIRVLFSSYATLGPIHKQDVAQLTQLELVSFSTNCIVADETHFCAGKFTISSPVFASTILKFLDLAYNNFTSVPGYLFQQSLMGIKLRGNPMTWIRKHDFDNSTNITYLNLAWTSQYIKTPLQIENGSFAMLKNLEVLDLSANMIRSLPDGIFAENLKLRALNLELNCLNMIEMNPSILPALPSLEELSVAGNTFCTATLKPFKRTIPRLVFSDSYLRFPNLTTLSLGNINRFPNTEFTPSALSRYLSYGSKYDTVDKGSFEVLRNLSRLKNLGLAVCGIWVLNTFVFDGLKLTHLDSQINQIGEDPKKLPKNLDSLLPVKNATLFSKSILRYNEFNANDILMNEESNSFNENDKFHSKVTFSTNSITDLQSFSLKYFSFATQLDLSYNRINYIHQHAFQNFASLRVLNLQYNPIRHIHHEALIPLVQLTDLQLNLTEHQFDFSIKFLENAQQNLILKYGDTGWHVYKLLLYYSIENTKVNFTKITSADLSYIRIPSYYISRNQAVFKPFRNLKKLTIDGAQFTFRLQSHFFSGVSKLRHLSMRDCWLEEFPYAALKRLRQLRHLDLSHNKIEVINKQANFSFTNLKTLILCYNFIYKISPGTLRSFFNSGLRTVDLRFNQIKNINPSIIDRVLLQDMESIDLRGNTVSCDCSLTDTFGSLIQFNKLNRSKLPGFLPDCSSAVVNYNGGCIACDQSTSEKPLSLFTYAITNNCHQEFLIHLVVWFNAGILFFLTTALTYKAMKKRMIKFILEDMRLQSFLNRSGADLPASDVFAYDGFVFYDKQNQIVGDWVDQMFVPHLENGNPSFQICVLGREDWCGMTQVQQVLLRMRASKKTIVILSENFISTPLCQYVMNVLEEWKYLNREEKCIQIVYGDSDTPPKMIFRRTSRCVYSELHFYPTKEDSHFWDLLTNAMMTFSG